MPYGASYTVVKDKYRRYDDTAIAARLLAGWRDTVRYVAHMDHPDSPYLAMVLTQA